MCLLAHQILTSMRILTTELLTKIVAEETVHVNSLLEGSKIAKDTKVKHTDSQLLYTVAKDVKADDLDVTLRTPEGKLIAVEKEEFADEYNLS